MTINYRWSNYTEYGYYKYSSRKAVILWFWRLKVIIDFEKKVKKR